MKIVPVILLATLALPLAVHAQGTIRGAEEGADAGSRAAGPVGGVVGGVVGAAAGTVGVQDRPRFREYAIHERRPSYHYDRDVRVGAVLPESDARIPRHPVPLYLRQRPCSVG